LGQKQYPSALVRYWAAVRAEVFQCSFLFLSSSSVFQLGSGSGRKIFKFPNIAKPYRWWHFFDNSQIDKTYMTIYKRLFIIFLFCTTHSVIAQNIKYADDFLVANKDSLPKVLLVGTFHFEYYNLDAHKVDKDKQIDILTDQKQKELKELLDYISIFKPTKICIEAFPEWNAVKKYNEYKAGQKKSVKDERYQIAFKLMDRFKLDTAYSINAESIANDFQSTKDSTLFMPYLQNLYDGYSDKDNPNYVKWRDYKTTLTTKISLLKYFKYLNSQNNLHRDFGAYLESAGKGNTPT
jgi:Family of unknown function (DUF5694)